MKKKTKKKLYDRSERSSIKDFLLKILYNFQIVFNTDLLLHTYYFLTIIKQEYFNVRIFNT